ncbi:(11Z)-hexadec-11-enoyl-CoA conjugase [Solenopsis invicta]|uniref:(11Z)-hexadec-11-enoyl-CoA conjugase n=1 Tax=Solenopsis invicta TaxID=13686 RepID=UPI00193D26A4|nr:(11Z)-hexadec-11-enoyl-CoA conjugase [Solenopsis invicta]
MMLDVSEISAIKTEKSIHNKASTELDKTDYEQKIVWKNVIIFMYIHIAGIYGLYLCIFRVKYWTFIWFTIVGVASGFGITVGAHRLWAHRSYKAKWPLRLILMIFNTIAFQDDIYQWVRDHRVHHKFTDTDADPYNVRRGFFFSHMGWLLVRKHPDVKNKGATVDCSDVAQDPIVAFQRKWYLYLMPFCCFIVPALIPWLVWNESLWYSSHVAVFRYCLGLHCTWTVNSIAHIWGMKPYNKSLTAAENIVVSIVAVGEGWHNYHHVFPWDYKAGEFGNYKINLSTAVIDFFAYLGLAYDLKTAPADMIKKRVLRNGEARS